MWPTWEEMSKRGGSVGIATITRGLDQPARS